MTTVFTREYQYPTPLCVDIVISRLTVAPDPQRPIASVRFEETLTDDGGRKELPPQIQLLFTNQFPHRVGGVEFYRDAMNEALAIATGPRPPLRSRVAQEGQAHVGSQSDHATTD